MNKKVLVFSGINLNEGGTLSIMRDCLSYVSENLYKEYRVIALVNKKELFKEIKNIEFIEFPNSKKSYLKRLYYEYFYFKKLSKQLKPYLWLSLHDMTPNVEAQIRVVYCHNPSPFYKMTRFEKRIEPKMYLFNLFYKYLYKINIKKNNFVIVQQNWLKKEFEKLYGIKNVIVSHPNIEIKKINYEKIEKKENKKTFFFPSIPRGFKNFEVICEAAENLEKKGIDNIEFILTVKKGINNYGDYIYEKYKHIKNIKFVGKLTREEVFSYYDCCDELIFPSKLETWGLPITEFKMFNKPIIVSDLPYAKETIGNYEKVRFFNPYSSKDLENKIIESLKNKEFERNNYYETNFTTGWENLMKIILMNRINNK